MSDFTQNLKEKIDKSKSKIIEVQEEQSKALMQSFKKSQAHLKEALVSDTKKLRSDMKRAEQTLENDIERYKALNREQIQEEQSKGNNRFNIILVLLIMILAALVFPTVKNWNEKRIVNEWKVPQKYQHSEKNGNKYILIPIKDLSSTDDKKSVYIQLEKGQ